MKEVNIYFSLLIHELVVTLSFSQLERAFLMDSQKGSNGFSNQIFKKILSKMSKKKTSG